jgi:hypothetical protein
MAAEIILVLSIGRRNATDAMLSSKISTSSKIIGKRKQHAQRDHRALERVLMIVSGKE